MSAAGHSDSRLANAYAAGVCAGYMSALVSAGVDPVTAESATWQVSDGLKRMGGPQLLAIALDVTDPRKPQGLTGEAVRVPMGDES